ncbi:MAG: FtsH protease activity modulator HflK [Halorhodospira halophila]|uniref:FtsH protease activity modulator HflK n=1 Tax=Halorhodospira TaxID=85108 RepID=UPI0019119016|nr:MULTISPECIES: FtsH protease activity modulator HflK [Halorhodospira]MBK5935230.1 HflK protein [Halorhodospira halophila]MBK5942977.1 HflK protein [Halorhodospira halophila]MCC3751146.1 FtsH protease activity modulator HflK [Halorhodospira halophila]MCG5528569.1 FtsH protease activity modulator HflK [Halorhodospira halophila]MCG5533577.1 FtsH protease activity modulator HflK [Halorhodospira sp. 9621]
MAWNEPGGGSRDPWGSGPKGGGSGGPPDLDEVFRKLREQLQGLFGGRMPSGPSRGPGATGIGLLALGAFVVWMLSGIYIVDQGWRGVELTFGRHSDTTEPGPHWHWPRPIGQIERVNVDQRRIAEVGYESMQNRARPVPAEALMITRDENIVDVRIAAQYEVNDPFLYLFNFRLPEQTLKQVTESAVREIIGKRELQYVLTEGRTEVAQETGRLLQEVMDEYRTGLQVVQVAVQDIQPPEPVQPAFEDAIRAREDEQRTINRAQAYANELIPRAQGQAARILEEADGYREQVIAQAEGDAARFEALVAEYRNAPSLMRQRIYLETMEEILGRVPKVMLDSESSQSLMYLPLDKLMDRRSGTTAFAGESNIDVPQERDAISPTQRAREALRDRGTR